jgi:hypothetical protein
MIGSFFSIDWEQWVTQSSLSLLSQLLLVLVLLIMMAVEWRVPHARAASAQDAWFNVLYALIAMILIAALRPLAMLVPLWLTKTVGTDG